MGVFGALLWLLKGAGALLFAALVLAMVAVAYLVLKQRAKAAKVHSVAKFLVAAQGIRDKREAERRLRGAADGGVEDMAFVAGLITQCTETETDGGGPGGPMACIAARVPEFLVSVVSQLNALRITSAATVCDF